MSASHCHVLARTWSRCFIPLGVRPMEMEVRLKSELEIPTLGVKERKNCCLFFH